MGTDNNNNYNYTSESNTGVYRLGPIELNGTKIYVKKGPKIAIKDELIKRQLEIFRLLGKFRYNRKGLLVNSERHGDKAYQRKPVHGSYSRERLEEMVSELNLD
jgi:hypothetical protein|tara:strand:- start:2891 stop:3202 length:312 start_codon:yes stop_codon:yes gene_type:complete